MANDEQTELDLDAAKFIELLLQPCDEGKPDHAWRRCHRCLAVNELEQRSDPARRLLLHAIVRLRSGASINRS